MAITTYPGVYIEEISSGVRTIVGVATSITAFIGRAPRGPVNEPLLINNYGDFQRAFGGLHAEYPLSYAVRDFYQNGGSQALIVRLFASEAVNAARAVSEALAGRPDSTAPADLLTAAQTEAAKHPAGSPVRAAADAVVAAVEQAVGETNATGATVKQAAANAGSRAVPATTRLALVAAGAPAPTPPQPGPPPAPPAPTPGPTPAPGPAPGPTPGPTPAPPPAPPAPGAPAAALTLESAAPGDWATNLKATVDYERIDATVAARYAAYGLGVDDLFNLTVQDTTPNGALERFLNVSVKPTAGPRRLDRVLAEESKLVRVPEKADGSGPDLPGAQPPEHSTGGSSVGERGTTLGDLDYQGDKDRKTGIYALKRADLFNLLCIPPDQRGGDTDPTVYQAAMTFCAQNRAMLLVDPPSAWSANRETAAQKGRAILDELGLNGPDARNAALYFPRVVQPDPMHEGQLDSFVPCGIVAGVMARTDAQRGVWKAPAGLDASVNGVHALTVNLNDEEHGLLNPIGVNVLRSFPVSGRVVWGARTLRGADQLADEYKYVPVRRLTLFIEESLYRGTQWVVFEPNDEPLWAQIRLNVGAFMQNLFRQGAFQGSSPREAYFVKCSKETTTQDDINRGIVNIEVGFLPLKPAEFVTIRIQQMAGQIAV